MDNKKAGKFLVTILEVTFVSMSAVANKKKANSIYQDEPEQRFRRIRDVQ